MGNHRHGDPQAPGAADDNFVHIRYVPFRGIIQFDRTDEQRGSAEDIGDGDGDGNRHGRFFAPSVPVDEHERQSDNTFVDDGTDPHHRRNNVGATVDG
jgi:hypothetical protein